MGELVGRGRLTHLGSHPIPLGFCMFVGIFILVLVVIGRGIGVLVVVTKREGW